MREFSSSHDAIGLGEFVDGKMASDLEGYQGIGLELVIFSERGQGGKDEWVSVVGWVAQDDVVGLAACAVPVGWGGAAVSGAFLFCVEFGDVAFEELEGGSVLFEEVDVRGVAAPCF